MRIDLHTHSLHSDGSDTPTELVEKAASARLDVVALTDHDTVRGWDEARAAGERLGVRVVTGVEFSTTNDGRGQHLLGYGFDPSDSTIVEMLSRAATSREDRVAALFVRLEDLGMPVDRAYVEGLAGGIPSRKHIAAGMVRAEHVGDETEAFRLYLNEGGPAYIERYRPTIEDAIAAVRAAGGVTVIAHPWDTSRGPAVAEDRLAALVDAGLAGIEVDHRMHDDAARARLRAVTAELGVVATGASDFHGTRKERHELGCFLTDPEEAGRLLGEDVVGR